MCPCGLSDRLCVLSGYDYWRSQIAAAFEPALRGSVEYHTAPNSDDEDVQDMDASTQPTLEELETSWAPGVFGMKYLTAAGITLLLYDGALNIGDEIRFVWLRPMDAMNLAFLITRYGTLGAMLLVTHAESVIRPVTITRLCASCERNVFRAVILNLTAIKFLSVAVTNIILVRRVYTLYDHRKIILRLLLFACMLTYIIAFAFVILTMREMIAAITWEPTPLRTCVLTSRPKFAVGFWTPQAWRVVFELFAFGLTITNAAERPRRAQSRLVSELNRDGFAYILMLFCIRTTNLVLSVLPPADLVVVHHSLDAFALGGARRSHER
ncbi:hypothetical protein BKA93DRAFT_754263 [Sparassis latifolia]